MTLCNKEDPAPCDTLIGARAGQAAARRSMAGAAPRQRARAAARGFYGQPPHFGGRGQSRHVST